MPNVKNPKERRLLRRKNHIAKDLRITPKYRQRVVPDNLREDEDERRFRRYRDYDPTDIDY